MISRNHRPWVVAALLATAGCAVWLYVWAWTPSRENPWASASFSQEDIGFESMAKPLAVGHILRARQKKVSIEEYMANDPVWDDVKREDPKQAFDCVGKRFQFYFYTCWSPALSLCYLPFVEWMGMKNDTVTMYSTFFSFAVFVLLFVLAWKACGIWHAIVSMLFLMSSLIWLIHVKVADAVWMPSVALLCVVALCLFSYMRTGSRRALVGAAGALGVLYLVGWIGHVFAFLLIGMVLAMEGPRSLKKMIQDGLVVACAALVTILAVAWCYAQYADCRFLEIFKTMHDNMMNRFTQGAIPGLHLTLAGKLAFAFKGLFIDSTMPEHLDKCLEGKPAVPVFFGVAMIVGLVFAVRDRRPYDRLLLIWLAAVFVYLCTASTYVHRYALLVLPAMAALAANGVIATGLEIRSSRLGKAFPLYGLLCTLLFGAAIYETHRDYYTTYVEHKPAGFEIDRGRGHVAVARFLRNGGSPADTLLVLGDSILFPYTAYVFNLYDDPFRFVYWNNYFPADAGTVQIQAWEQAQLERYRRIVYVFSTVLFPDQRTGRAKNDWRPFLKAHPRLNPAYVYSYAGRKPNYYIFEVRRE